MPGGDNGIKGPDAFRTIGEVAAELGLAQHILRYWETKFPQLKPLQRAGNRRYYRPEDVDLLRRIHRLLSTDGYTVRGVQQLLKGKEEQEQAGNGSVAVVAAPGDEDLVGALKRVRAELYSALKS